MAELTMGDQHFIAESTMSWKMILMGIKGKMKSVPKETEDRIRALEKQYRTEFYEFFLEERGKDTDLDADGIQSAFEKSFKEKCPEFFDVRALFSACSPGDLAAAEEKLKEVDGWRG